MSGTSRDPRVDPKRGDKLLIDAIKGNVTPNRGGIIREVTYVSGNRVEYAVGRFGYDAPLSKWRDINNEAEIIHAD